LLFANLTAMPALAHRTLAPEHPGLKSCNSQTRGKKLRLAAARIRTWNNNDCTSASGDFKIFLSHCQNALPFLVDDEQAEQHDARNSSWTV
jgi:hypothetical protein